MPDCESRLCYDLSPNVTLSLADHISFTIERCRKNIRVKMPLAYDVEHLYPKEYRLAKHAIKRLSHEYRIYVPDMTAWMSSPIRHGDVLTSFPCPPVR